MNITLISGRVTKEVTVKGKTGTFTLANDRDYPFNKDQNGNKVTNFITCKVIGEKNVERAAQYLTKGTAIIVKGYYFRDTWKEDGAYKEFNYVLVEKWEWQAGKSNESEGYSNEPSQPEQPQQESQAVGQPAPDNSFMAIPDDIAGSLPFR